MIGDDADHILMKENFREQNLYINLEQYLNICLKSSKTKFIKLLGVYFCVLGCMWFIWHYTLFPIFKNEHVLLLIFEKYKYTIIKHLWIKYGIYTCRKQKMYKIA